MLRKLLHVAYLLFCLGLILACVKVSIADDAPAPAAAPACTADSAPPTAMPGERAEPCAPLR